MTEGNLRQSASKGRGDNLVSSMCFCVCLSPLPATPALFTKTIELGVESVQLENSRKIQILKEIQEGDAKVGNRRGAGEVGG